MNKYKPHKLWIDCYDMHPVENGDEQCETCKHYSDIKRKWDEPCNLCGEPSEEGITMCYWEKKEVRVKLPRP